MSYPTHRSGRTLRTTLCLATLLIPCAAPATAQQGEELKLHFPELTHKTMSESGTGQFFSNAYAAPLIESRIVNLARIRQAQRSPDTEAYFLGTLTGHIAALLNPLEGESIWSENSLRSIWSEELHNVAKPELFESGILQAMHAAPPVMECNYDQNASLTDELRAIRQHMLGVNLAFWTAPPPAELAPERLLNFPASATGMHPLIAIGPAQSECPPTLGLALEAHAEQLPGLVPAAAAPEPAIAAAEDPAPDPNAADATIRRLLGMSVTTTRTSPWGDDVGQDFLIVDALDPAGPAAKAGFRSGDFIGGIGWGGSRIPADFAAELEARAPERAAVLSRLLPGQEDPTAHLVVFAEAPAGDLVQMSRDAGAQEGWTVLAQSPWSTFLVKGDDWCARHVEARNAMDIDADDLSLNDVLPDAMARVAAECPALESITILNMSSKLDAPIHFLRGRLQGGNWISPFETMGIDGLSPGGTVRETRAIAEANAPECDRLAAHPGDPMRRYGLAGIEFIAEGELEAALDACIAATDAAPQNAVALFQLGRVLYEGGVFDAALPTLREAADLGHGGAQDYLGRMYLAGEGVPRDAAEAQRRFLAARDAGFQAITEDDPAVIALENVTMARLIGEAFNLSFGMRAAGDPAYADRNIPSDYAEPGGRSFVAFLAMEISDACGTEDALTRIRELAETDPSERAGAAHAVHLFGSRMPQLRPVIRSAIEADRRAVSVGAGQSVTALLQRHDCLSPQIRQLVMNISEKLVLEAEMNAQ